jgi:hypothetical protein
MSPNELTPDEILNKHAPPMPDIDDKDDILEFGRVV